MGSLPHVGAGTDELIAYFKDATNLPPAMLEAAIGPAIDALYTSRDAGLDMHRAGAEAAVATLSAIRFLIPSPVTYHTVCWECGALEHRHRPLCSRDPINRTPFGRMMARARNAGPLDKGAIELLSKLRQLTGKWVAILDPGDLAKVTRLNGAGLDIRTKKSGGTRQAMLP